MPGTSLAIPGDGPAALKLSPFHADKSLIAEAPRHESSTDDPCGGPERTVQRIMLRSGQTATVVRSTPLRDPDVERDLHVCRRCECQFVQWSDWEQAGRDLWRIRLHCPNCGWWRRGTFSGDELEPLENQLDGGFNGLLEDLKRLTQANMADELDRLAHALQTDLILPEDF